MERRLYTLLAPYGLARYVGEVVALHGSAAAELVLEDPYSLTRISGIGFHSADRLAVDHGVEPGSRSRTRAAAVHALREAENRGHTHLPKAGAGRGDARAARHRAVPPPPRRRRARS